MIYFYQQSCGQDFHADISIQTHQRSKNPVSSKGVVTPINLPFQTGWFQSFTFPFSAYEDSSVFFIFCACFLTSLVIAVLIIILLRELQTDFLWKLVIGSKQSLWPWRHHFLGYVSTVKWTIVLKLNCKGRVVLFHSCTRHGRATTGFVVHKT